jgi:2,3-bisphosphoglycerate-independent phosphoglycerate mutase
MSRPKPVVLCILDGWGYAPPSASNAISLARKPVYDKLQKEFPSTLIYTSGRYVGLPNGQMGNSEVGHLNIGAGRIVYMDITKVDLMIEDGSLFKNPVLLGAMEKAKQNGRKLHFIGLLSDGGVHSHQNHLEALLKMAKQNGVERAYVHAFMDGRDTPPTSGAEYLERHQQAVREIGIGQVATVNGRYWAMDRDRKWDREKKAFDAMVHGKGEGGSYDDPVKGIKESYAKDPRGDEFVLPFVCVDANGKPVATISDEDVVINFNFRADRARQITRVLCRESGITAQGGAELDGAAELDQIIPLAEVPKKLDYLCFTEYNSKFSLPVVIPPEKHENILADVMAQHNLRNLRSAETEKYAHVTFFFNGGVEKPFPGEERLLVQSPKVATYDLKPEMSAAGVAEGVAKGINSNTFDVVVVNFANPDMVGHSGLIEPTVKAIEAVDQALGVVYSAVKQSGGAMLITADHGNAEQMVDPETGGPFTAHTTNPVPLLYVAENANQFTLRQDGSLRDLSPTVLGIMGLEQPKEMTGADLRVKKG